MKSPSFPLSRYQQFHWETLRFWAVEEGVGGRDGPFIALNFDGALNLERLHDALSELGLLHDVLRVVLVDLGNSPSQSIDLNWDVPISFIDLSGLNDLRRTNVLDAIITSEKSLDFDLRRGPLWQCVVVKLEPEKHVLIFHFCHLVLDGISLMIFLRQLGDLYSGKSVPKPLPYQATVEHSFTPAQGMSQRLSYWKRAIHTPRRRLRFPTDFASSPPAFVAPRTLELDCSSLEADIKTVCKDVACTPFSIYVGAYAILLACSTGTNGIVFGSSSARVDEKLDPAALGYYLDLLLIPIDVNPQMTIAEFLANVWASILAADQNSIPFIELARCLNDRFDDERPYPGMHLYDAWVRGRLFDAVTLSNANEVSVAFGGYDLNLYAATAGYSDRQLISLGQQDLFSRYFLPSLYLNNAAGTSAYMEFNSAAFSFGTVRRMCNKLRNIIGAMTDLDSSVASVWQRAELK